MGLLNEIANKLLQALEGVAKWINATFTTSEELSELNFVPADPVLPSARVAASATVQQALAAEVSAMEAAATAAQVAQQEIDIQNAMYTIATTGGAIKDIKALEVTVNGLNFRPGDIPLVASCQPAKIIPALIEKIAAAGGLSFSDVPNIKSMGGVIALFGNRCKTPVKMETIEPPPGTYIPKVPKSSNVFPDALKNKTFIPISDEESEKIDHDPRREGEIA